MLMTHPARRWVYSQAEVAASVEASSSCISTLADKGINNGCAP
jgi:hypothetical protein